MKKGEIRRDAILKTAEKLFFEKGYDDTSVQDILNAMNLSKGGFYHYFDTKLALLEEITKQRALTSIEALGTQIRSNRVDPLTKINKLLNFVNLFERETPDYIAIALKISYIDNDVNFRDRTRSFVIDQLRPMISNVIFEGIRSGCFFTRYPAQIGDIALMLAYDINDEVGRILATESADSDCVIRIIDILNAYRDSVENLLGASFGKIELFDLEHTLANFRQTAVQLEHLKGNDKL